MPSIIKGYNYDIFISYRKKDNKGYGWVSEFIEETEKAFASQIFDWMSFFIIVTNCNYTEKNQLFPA